jgi:transposase InsO family protein
MWVSAKEAVPIIGIKYNTIKLQIHRNTAKFKYRHVAGQGRGGKNLEIWIDKDQPVTAKPKTQPVKSFCVRDCDANARNDGSKKNKTPLKRTNAYLRLTKQKQLQVREKIALVESYVKRERWMTYEQWAEGKQLPTKQHFLRLVSLYRQGIHDQNVLDLFCDSRGRPKGRVKMTTEMQEMAQRYILRRDIHPNDIGIYTLMKHAFGAALPSCDTVCRYLKRWREENKVLVAYAKDPDRARGKYRAAFGSASQKAKYKNHYWELDGTPADIITSDGKRQTIIGAIDIYSRRVVLTVEETSNSYALARNLREGMLKLGIPENVITDNGKDYKSNHFESVCQLLHINKKEVAPYSGWCKPHIERFFGTMTRELFRGLEGFCGHNVAERSAIQNSLSFEKKQEARRKWRLQKHTESSFVKAMLNKDNTLGVFVPLSPEELKAYLTNWVENIYEQRIHSGINAKPADKYTLDLTPAKMINNERMLDVLLGEWIERTVGKDGILMRRDGKEAQYTHPALIDYIGERVYVALGSDMGQIYVYNNEMAPICTATDASLEGISREAMKDISRQMRKLENESLKLVQKADELAQKYNDPTIKDVINIRQPVKMPKRVKGHKVDIELPKENKSEVVMNGDRPFFDTDLDALIWAVENGKEYEFSELINERLELYEMAKREVEYKQTKVG